MQNMWRPFPKHLLANRARQGWERKAGFRSKKQGPLDTEH